MRNQNLVAGSDTHREALAILVKGTGANSEDLGLVLLLDAALRKEDAGGGLSLGLDALDQDAVQEGSEVLDVAEERLLTQGLVCRRGKERPLSARLGGKKPSGGRRYRQTQLETELESRCFRPCVDDHRENIPL